MSKEAAKYQIIVTTEYVEDSGLVTTYGIRYHESDAPSGQSRGEDIVIPNISTQPAFVEELVEQLNQYDADPIHLKDLLYDYLP